MNATRIASPHSKAVRMSLRVLTGAPFAASVQSSIALGHVRSTLVRGLLLLVVTLAAIGGACGGSDTAAVPGGEADDGPPVFVATTVDGRTIDAGDYEGQDLVLWFWAPW